MKQIHVQIILCVFVLISLCACASKAPEMGMHDGAFAVCSESDDCVSSQATDAVHKVDPIKASGVPEKVMVDLSNAIESIFGGKVLAVDDKYLRAEFKSTVMRTMDDAEFFYDEQAGVIHVHAISRGELFDFESNRKRIEELRLIFEKSQ
ncbi:DUF1499 domain-containing protein [uncultured Pseudodesulfovibrio sp.]|uniref:DUF1499 domain-containing protein n=1 Tax=uncultured Pseudodesulfovibrio sp. TaxID=2035858 RepID=UPI0029C72745|nr:DUF1499 domain-containing protein [uncultured Pseudodesulfovibrio sp.]